MNKNIAIVIIAVILLGMGLITYNEYTTPAAAPVAATPVASSTVPTSQHEETHLGENETAPNTAQEKAVIENTAPATPTTSVGSLTVPTIPAAPKEASAVKTPAAMEAPQSPATPVQPVQAVAMEKPAPTAPMATTPTPPPVAVSASEKEKVAAPKAPVQPKPTAPKVVEDPVQKALAASRKESSLPAALIEPKKEVVKEAPKAAAKLVKTIKRITVFKAGDGVTVRLDSNVVPTYKTMRLVSPERLVLDLDGTWKLRAPGVPANNLVSNVRIGDHKEGTRIVIDLKKAPSDIRYLKYGETGLDVRIR